MVSRLYDVILVIGQFLDFIDVDHGRNIVLYCFDGVVIAALMHCDLFDVITSIKSMESME